MYQNQNKDKNDFEDTTGLSSRMKPNDTPHNDMPIKKIENAPLEDDY